MTTLGELISTLKRKNLDASVKFDFGGFVPDGIDSYRGYYEQLAIGYKPGKEKVSIADLIKLCEDANGETFAGWKGGEYTMDDDTPVWVANRGKCHGTAIRDILDFGWHVVIATEYVD